MVYENISQWPSKITHALIEENDNAFSVKVGNYRKNAGPIHSDDRKIH